MLSIRAGVCRVIVCGHHVLVYGWRRARAPGVLDLRTCAPLCVLLWGQRVLDLARRSLS